MTSTRLSSRRRRPSSPALFSRWALVVLLDWWQVDAWRVDVWRVLLSDGQGRDSIVWVCVHVCVCMFCVCVYEVRIFVCMFVCRCVYCSYASWSLYVWMPACCETLMV